MPSRRSQPSSGAVRIDDVSDLITPMAVRVAATLRLADYVGDGVGTVDELAAKCGAHAPALHALVRHLVAKGVFARDGDGGLALTTLGRQLRLAQDYLDVENSVGRSELSLVHLLHSVRTGAPAYPLMFGGSFWNDLTADARLKASFDAMNDRHHGGELPPLLAAYDWSSVPHLIDLGGGSGGLLIRLMSAVPGLRGTVVELPGNAEVAGRNLAAAGFADRCTAVAGDFFRPLTHLPRGSFVINSVLHDWNDEDTATILGRCAEVLRPRDRVLIIDSFIEDGVDDTDMDLRMLALFGGRQRTVADLAGVARAAGLRLAGARRLRRKWLLELAPAVDPAGAGADR